MGKLDTAGIEFLEGADLVKPKRISKAKPAYQAATAAAYLSAPRRVKQPVNTLQDASSYRLVRELIVRHYQFVLSALFWIAIGALIVKRG